MADDQLLLLKVVQDRRAEPRSPSTGRRSFPRYRITDGSAITVEVEGAECDVLLQQRADLLDLSSGGASLLTGGAPLLVVGERVVLDFSDLKGWALGQRLADIRWVQDESGLGDLVLLGVQFVEPIARFLETIPSIVVEE